MAAARRQRVRECGTNSVQISTAPSVSLYEGCARPPGGAATARSACSSHLLLLSPATATGADSTSTCSPPPPLPLLLLLLDPAGGEMVIFSCIVHPAQHATCNEEQCTRGGESVFGGGAVRYEATAGAAPAGPPPTCMQRRSPAAGWGACRRPT